jgi:hypothetical protein
MGTALLRTFHCYSSTESVSEVKNVKPGPVRSPIPIPTPTSRQRRVPGPEEARARPQPS